MPKANPDLAYLLKLPSFISLYIARLFTISGYQMLCVAIGWHLYDITGSAMDLGLIGLIQFLPRILFALHAGMVADRFDRKRVASFMQLLQGLAALAMLLSLYFPQHTRWLIFVVSFAIGAARTFEFPAVAAMLPRVVPREVLPSAIALSSSAMQLATIAAPALGGIVYALGTSVVYSLTAALYLLSSILMRRIQLLPEDAPAPAPAPTNQETGLNSLLAGVRFIRSKPAILGAISLDLFAVLLGGATALLPIYAKDILHTGPWGLGLLRAAPALGALGMSAWLAHHPIKRNVGKIMFSAVAVFGLATIAFGMSRWMPISFLALVLLGIADMVSVVIRGSFVQLETPDAMRGRVSAVNSLFIGASNQLGEFESGIVAAAIGPLLSVVSGGLGTLLVVALWIHWFPQLAKQDKMPGT